jgi:hypothetical protein
MSQRKYAQPIKIFKDAFQSSQPLSHQVMNQMKSISPEEREKIIRRAMKQLGLSFDYFVYAFDNCCNDNYDIHFCKKMKSNLKRLVWNIIEMTHNQTIKTRYLNAYIKMTRDLESMFTQQGIQKIIDDRFKKLGLSLSIGDIRDSLALSTSIQDAGLLLTPEKRKQVTQRLTHMKHSFHPTSQQQARNYLREMRETILHSEVNSTKQRKQVVLNNLTQSGAFSQMLHIGAEFNIPDASQIVTQIKQFLSRQRVLTQLQQSVPSISTIRTEDVEQLN